MEASAKPFYRACIGALTHAESHLGLDESFDSAQVILSADFACDMLLKAVLLERGESIIKARSRTLDLPSMLKMVQPKKSADVEVLHEKRNSIQHLLGYTGKSEAAESYEVAWSFCQDLLSKEFALDINSVVNRGAPEAPTPSSMGDFIEPSNLTQRDACFGDGLLVWADARTGPLRVRSRSADGWLTPDGEFEHMPCTDGHYVAAYRQGGGIVLYEGPAFTRSLLANTGGPGAVEGGIVAAQGVGIHGGLGGGVWLLPIDGSDFQQVSATGDSPRLSAGRVVWQELVDGGVEIRMRAVAGGQIDTLAQGAGYPDIHGSLLVYVERGPPQKLVALDLAGGKQMELSTYGSMPSVRHGLVAFLEGDGPRLDLVVHDCVSSSQVLRVENAGFPIGRGPVLTDDSVIWESLVDQRVTNLREFELPAT